MAPRKNNYELLLKAKIRTAPVPTFIVGTGAATTKLFLL
jgi:hypothetical protein